MLKRLAILGAFLAGVLPIYGHEVSCQPASHQSYSQPLLRLSAPARFWIGTIDQDAAVPESDSPKNDSPSYFSVLISANNLPNLLLFFAALVAIWVALRTLKTIGKQTKATEGAANTAIKDLAFSNRAYVGARVDKS